jgi:uncharacterized protein (DUF433 family)
MYTASMDYRDYLSQDHNVAGGAVVMKGTRVPLRTVLASLAEGDAFETLIAAFPSLTEDHLRAAVAFAAASALEDQPLPAVARVG